MKILYLVNDKDPISVQNNDYTSDMLLHGLRDLYGKDVVDFPGSWYLYKDEAKKRNLDHSRLWGKGFCLKDLLDNFNEIDRDDIQNKIKNKYFDLIIYPSVRRNKALIEEVVKHNNRFIFIDGEDDLDIDVSASSLGLYFKRELREKKTKIEPINFAIPKQKIIEKINLKPKNLLAPLIPGRYDTYIYDDEKIYNKMYEESIFALTYKKGGWDCFRHYEILMNGCLPIFLNLEKCPNLTMTNLPKKKLVDIKNRYEKIIFSYSPFKYYKFRLSHTTHIFNHYLKSFFSSKTNLETFLKKEDEIFELKEQMLNFTKTNLTTTHLAKYVINKSNEYLT